MPSLLLHAWRSWKNARGVAVLAILALAIGIGSTTAIYTVIRAVLLNPLPYPHADRFVSLFSARFTEPGQRGASSNLDLVDYQQRNRSFDVFGWFGLNDYNLTAPGQPQLVKGLEVSPSLVDNLGVPPIMGRWFQDAAAEHGNVYLAVISSSLWHRLGSDPGILGLQLTLNHHPYNITGVMPPWFKLPVSDAAATVANYDVWVPLDPQGPYKHRDVAPYFCYARMKPGVTFAQAESDVKRVAAEIAREHPDHLQYTASLISLLDTVVQDIRPTLLLLLGAAGALLLITCANVAGLLLVRSVTRARETAVRVALGAARWQLASQYFFEGLLLGLGGAILGIGVSVSMVHVVVSLAAASIPRADEITTDWSVLAVALAVAILASVLFSLAPLWQAMRTLPNEVLTEGVRASAGARSRGLSRLLVIAEIALAFALVAVSALLLAHLGNLIRIHPGFDPGHLLTFKVNAGDTEYPDIRQLVPYQNRLLHAVENVPGVASAAFVNQIPLEGCCFSTTLVPDGGPADQKVERVSFLPISPDYFRTMRIPLIQGRTFNAHDASGDVVVIINQATARRYWPGTNPIGAYARIDEGGKDRFQVVGVVGDVKNDGLSKPTVPELYFPYTRVPVNQMNWVVRSSVPPETLINPVRRAIEAVNGSQPIYGVETMTDILQNSVGAQRLQSFMISFFALAALMMAILGIYGVISYSVRQRTVEIGTRMAIGANARDLLRLIVGDGLQMAFYGIAIGAVAVSTVIMLLRTSAFAVQIESPLPLIFATLAIAALTATACFIPAWRATLISPMVAIRNEPGTMWQATRLGFLHVAEQFSGLIHKEDEQAAASESELLAEIADAGRDAGSFREAIQAALAQLCERMGAESLALFVQKASGQPYRCHGVVPDACVDTWILPADALIASRLRYYAGALPVDRQELDAAARWAAELQPQHLPEIAILRELGAALAIRIAVRNEISGILFVGKPQGFGGMPQNRSPYSAQAKRLLRAVAAQFAMMIENGRLTDRIVEQERFRRELQVAGEVQKRLFPEKWPDTASLQLAGICMPARGVGGDYYDFIDLGNRNVGIALADVAGKGIAAALIMSVVQASLRSLAGNHVGNHAGNHAASLAELTTKMNRLLHRSTGSNSYATFFYAQIDQEAKQLRYVNAGHNPPYLLRGGIPFVAATAPIEELTTGGTIIGMFAQSQYEEAVIDIRPGDVLIVFTDGVPEALNPADEEYGEDRLKEALVNYAHLPVNEMASRLQHELQQWISDAAQYDDLTFILMKVS